MDYFVFYPKSGTKVTARCKVRDPSDYLLNFIIVMTPIRIRISSQLVLAITHTRQAREERTRIPKKEKHKIAPKLNSNGTLFNVRITSNKGYIGVFTHSPFILPSYTL